MKKAFLTLFLLAAISSVYALEASVTAVTGKAEYLVDGTWTELKVGSKLSKGDVVQTGFKSELTLQIGSATVNLAALSRVTIEQLAEKKSDDGSVKDTTSLYVDSGTIHSAVKKTTDNRRVGFTVRSAAATASVRGTEFTFSNRYRKSETRTLEGSVAVWKTVNKEVAIAPDEVDEVVAEEQTSDAPSADTETVAVATESVAEEAVENETAAADTPAAEAPATRTNDTQSDEPAPAAPAAEKPGRRLGNAPTDIAEQAPRDAFIVSKGQTSKISNAGKVTTPKKAAEAAIKELPAAPQSAVVEEKPVEVAPEKVEKQSGTLTVRPIF